MSEYFAMGGHGIYVWPAFGLTAVVLLANLLLALQRRKRIVEKLKRGN